MAKAIVFSATALLALAGSAFAQPVDGSYKGSYGSPLVYQQNGTGFGDSGGRTGGNPYPGGSELDAAFWSFDGANVHLLFTGNLEANNNKFAIFIDTGNAAGQNQISNATFPGVPGNYNGMKFDTGFNATHFIQIGNNQGTSPALNMYVDGGNAVTQTGSYLGSNDAQSGGVLSGGTNFMNIAVALDNSNALGVTSSGPQGFNALTAFTGIEVSIPLASLGIASPSFKVCAFVNGGNADYLSNQFLGSLANGTGNLGDDGAGNYTGGNLNLIDLNQFAGNQYFVVPAPGSAGLLALGGLLAARRRRA